MSRITISIGSDVFYAEWERRSSPRTCAAFSSILPFVQRIVHARWSGEACWVPLGEFHLGVPMEDTTGRPAPGQLLFYSVGASETEILIPYGSTRFSSVAGDLVGTRFLTIKDDLARLASVGRDVLWNGSREIRFDEGN